jgi:hypothetical protein
MKKPRNWREIFSIGFGIVILCSVSGLLGGALSRGLVSSPVDVTYADLIAILLTGVTTLLAIAGSAIAIFALLGWSAIESKAINRAEEHVRKSLEKGEPLEQLIGHKIEEMFLNYVRFEMDEGDPVYSLIKNQIEARSYQDIKPVRRRKSVVPDNPVPATVTARTLKPPLTKSKGKS